MNLYKTIGLNKTKILLDNKNKLKEAKLSKQIEVMEDCDLRDIKGVGEQTIKNLIESGVRDKKDLLSLGEEGLKDMKINPITKVALNRFIEKNK